MKVGVKKIGLYQYEVYVKRFFFVRKIGHVNASLDGKRIDLYISDKWRSYARSIAEFIDQNYISKQFSEQGS